MANTIRTKDLTTKSAGAVVDTKNNAPLSTPVDSSSSASGTDPKSQLKAIKTQRRTLNTQLKNLDRQEKKLNKQISKTTKNKKSTK